MENPPAKNRLLLVDGDPKSLRVLDVSLKKAGFDVTTASSGRDALASLAAELPDLIISDTDLDEMDGFELCNRIKAKPDWAKIPFLFVSGRKSIEDKIRGLELGVDDYLTKPIYIKEIGIRVRTALQRAERERMESRREGRTRFAGDLSDVGVVDLVQTIELNRKSGIVHIVNRDDRRGSIFFRDGKVIDAEVGRLSGAHALYRLFSWSEGQFAVEFKPIRRHDAIDMSTAGLLMEGMRRLDEVGRLIENLCPPTSVLEVDCRVLAEELAELPDEMNSVLRLCDGARTLQEVVEDSDHPDLETLTILNTLFADQILFAREAPNRGLDAEPGARLANWLSQGGADPAAPAAELPSLTEIPPPSDAMATTTVPAAGLVRAAPVLLSAEETLGAALPSCVDDGARPAVEARAAATLKGVPAEGLFGEPQPSHADAPSSPSQSPEAKHGRITQPMGLAERLLSDDSVVQAQAVHEAISDDAVVEPATTDRHTQSYRGPALAAAAIVQDVVSSTHGGPPASLPSDPGRPHKEVDWGAWPAVASPASLATAAPPGLSPVSPPLASPPTPKVGDSSAELDPADLQEVEPADEKPAELTTSPAAATDRGDMHAAASADEEATRLSDDDVLPVDAAPAEPPAQVNLGLASSASSDTTMVVAPRRPASMRQLWLLILGAFALGVLVVLLIERRAAPPEDESSLAASGTPSPPTTPSPGNTPAPPSVRSASPPVQAAAAPEPPVEPPAAGTPPAAPARPSLTPPSQPLPESPAAANEPGQPALAELRAKCIATNADGKGKARAVVAACRPALATAANDAEIMVILARAEIDRGRLAEARSLAKKALAADPNRVEAYVYLGTAEQEAGKTDEARTAYRKYLELAPDGRFAREIRAILNNL